MAELRVDIDAIGRNTEAVAALLRRHRLDLVGVTKGCLGEPRVGKAILEGGASALADTRDPNLRRLRSGLPGVELHRIHLPSLAEPFEPGDITYVSSWAGAEAVATLGGSRRPRRVMVALDTGDEREGAPLELLPDLAAAITADPRLDFAGISTNYACFRGEPAGIRGSIAAVARAGAALRAADFPVPRVSGGNSSALWLLVQGEILPPEVTELRCGEALLLGQDALFYQALPGCRTDACVLRAEVLEEYTRPAPGGGARRLVLGVGRQDLASGRVRFLEPGLEEIGRSADYLVAEASAEFVGASVGETLEMIPAYEALVASWTSPYVELRLS
jgi:predicted amino acid racemase